MAISEEVREQHHEGGAGFRRATPDEVRRLAADVTPFDFDAWMASEVGSDRWTDADEADWAAWMAEREAVRQHGTERLEGKLTVLDE